LVYLTVTDQSDFSFLFSWNVKANWRKYQFVRIKDILGNKVKPVVFDGSADPNDIMQVGEIWDARVY